MSIALVALLAGVMPARDTTRLSIETAIRLALERGPSLEAARQSLVGAAGAVREARARWYPQLGAEAGLLQHEEPMLVAPIHGLTPTTFPPFDQTLVQGSVGLEWTVFDGGSRSGHIAQARAQETVAQAQTEHAAQRLIAAAVRAYADVLAAADAVAAEELRREALASEATRVGRFLREGRAAPLEQLRVNAAVASAEASRASALARAEVTEASLARLLGIPLDQTRAALLQPLRPVADALRSRDSLLALARARSPEIQAAAARLAATEAALKTARAAWYPRLRLDGRLATYGSGSGHYSTEWQSGLRLDWPVFTGGARGAGVDRARAAAAEAEAALRDLELSVSNRVDQAIAAVTESTRRMEALEAAVGHLTEAQRVEALALDQGAGTQTDFLRAAADLAEARAALAQARAGWIAARVELAQLSGSLTPAAALAFVTTEQ